MNKRLIITVLVNLFGLSIFCGASFAGTGEAPAGHEVVKGNTGFALDLYNGLKHEKGNLFFSPFSISTALAMTYGGAAGNTAREMAEVLHFPGTPSTLHLGFGPLLKEMDTRKTSDGGVRLALANSLWPHKDYRFHKQFMDMVETCYDSGVFPVDYAKSTEKTRLTINDWVEKKTENKIPELIKRGILDTLTRMVLVNAIYFKGNWQTKFSVSQTSGQPFFLPGGKTVNTPMMAIKHKFKYGETDDLQLLEMPYSGGRFALVTVLPKNKNGLDALEGQLTVKNLEQWLDRMGRRDVKVWFPKLKLNTGFRLDKTLAKMGMRDAFNPKSANFSGMDPKNGIYISAVVHQATMDLDEKGTEAAAATAVVMKRKGVSLRPAAVFRADHPFVFFIRDYRTGTILFMGRITNPAR